jgi:hypothetical protein
VKDDGPFSRRHPNIRRFHGLDIRKDVRQNLAARICRQEPAELVDAARAGASHLRAWDRGRFYSQVRKYHHECGKVYWSMASTPEEATLINRCDEAQAYEARLASGTLPRH